MKKREIDTWLARLARQRKSVDELFIRHKRDGRMCRVFVHAMELFCEGRLAKAIPTDEPVPYPMRIVTGGSVDLAGDKMVMSRWVDAVDRIMSGHVSAQELTVFSRVLQLFIENKLGAVLHERFELRRTHDEQMAFFSTPVDQLRLPGNQLERWQKCGVRFAGELFRFALAYRDPTRFALLRLGYSPECDVWGMGWRPSYLSDPTVLAALDREVVSLKKGINHWTGKYDRVHVGNRFQFGVRVFGELIGRSGFDRNQGRDPRLRRDSYWSEDLQNRLNEVPELHAAMFLPEDWESSGAFPLAQELLATEGRAKAFIELHGDAPETYPDAPTHEESRAAYEVIIEQRQKVLLEALKDERFPLRFIYLVVFKGNQFYLDREGQRWPTLRSLLRVRDGARSIWDFDSRCRLSAWGLDYGLDDKQFDAIFGENSPL